jgi:hypothetical protein
MKANAKSCGFSTVTPQDLRRTCARLCYQAGGELEQIQFLLGHLGCKQRFQNAVNDPSTTTSGWSRTRFRRRRKNRIRFVTDF